jgi:hypothetical protein
MAEFSAVMQRESANPVAATAALEHLFLNGALESE